MGLSNKKGTNGKSEAGLLTGEKWDRRRLVQSRRGGGFYSRQKRKEREGRRVR